MKGGKETTHFSLYILFCFTNWYDIASPFPKTYARKASSIFDKMFITALILLSFERETERRGKKRKGKK